MKTTATKIALLLTTALGSASAFAPSQAAQKVAPLAATTAELESLNLVDLETGKKIVSG